MLLVFNPVLLDPAASSFDLATIPRTLSSIRLVGVTTVIVVVITVFLITVAVVDN